MGHVERRVVDGAMLKLLRSWLRAGVCIGYLTVGDVYLVWSLEDELRLGRFVARDDQLASDMATEVRT
jgi:hypothetical protein